MRLVKDGNQEGQYTLEGLTAGEIRAALRALENCSTPTAMGLYLSLRDGMAGYREFEAVRNPKADTRKKADSGHAMSLVICRGN